MPCCPMRAVRPTRCTYLQISNSAPVDMQAQGGMRVSLQVWTPVAGAGHPWAAGAPAAALHSAAVSWQQCPCARGRLARQTISAAETLLAMACSLRRLARWVKLEDEGH